MLSQEKYMFDKCKKISNSSPKRVHHETLKIHHNSVKSLQKDLRDCLKIARNEIGDLTGTVKVSLQKQQQPLFITRQSARKWAKASRSTKSCSSREQEQQSLN